jgi:hypothetical protein
MLLLKKPPVNAKKIQTSRPTTTTATASEKDPVKSKISALALAELVQRNFPWVLKVICHRRN